MTRFFKFFPKIFPLLISAQIYPLPIPFTEAENYRIETQNSQLETQFIDSLALILYEAPNTEIYFSHFFHLLEHLVGIWSFYADNHSEKVEWILLAKLNEHFDWKGPNEINYHLLKALFPNAKVRTWNEFLNEYPGQAICFQKAFLSDRFLSFQSPECVKINKMLGAARPYLSSIPLKHLAEKVHAYAGVEPALSDRLRITYLKRNPPRHLSSNLEQQLFALIKNIPNTTLRIEDFATISFHKQIEIIANTDCLIGVHGNGLSHLLFLPNTARVIEIFPPNSHALDYRLFAEAKGIKYTSIIANQGIISKEDAYRIGAFGPINTPIEELNLSLIMEALESTNLSQ